MNKMGKMHSGFPELGTGNSMPIVYASDGILEENRACVASYLQKKREQDPNYTIVDIGGGANPWFPNADYVVDIVPVKNRETICGDLNDTTTWEKVRHLQPDFLICTHVLEDIRDPFFVIDEMCRSSKAGYVSTPTKHQEFSRQESIFYVGHCHHRWIYTLHNNTLKTVAKMPIVNYWASAFFLFRKLCAVPYFQRKLDILGLFWPAMPDLPWLDKRKGLEPRELGFIWEGDFEYSCINNDYAGASYKDLATLYFKELRDGL